jgi:hypothetical protein
VSALYWWLEPSPYGMPHLPYWLYTFLSSYPRLGVLLLGVGLILLCWQRHKALLWFALPFSLSNGAVYLASSLRNPLGEGAAGPMLLFLVLELILIGWSFIGARSAWISALFIGLGVLSVVLYQGVISMMLLTGQYI